MDKEIIIIRTKSGHKYAEAVAKKINNLGVECSKIVCWEDLESFMEQNECSPENTLFHFRTAGPNVNPKAFELEKQGYRVINSAKVLDRTSDKFKSYEWAHQQGIELPITKKGKREEIKEYIHNKGIDQFVLKPINSNGMGAFCFRSSLNDPELDNKLSDVPGKEIIIQEFVKYIKIFRVIVVGNKALDKAVFYDEPTSDDWKVSVCINPAMKLDKNPDPKLLTYAKHLADVFDSEVAFIDIYETKDGYVLSEINTACTLRLHEKKSGYSISNDIAEYLVSELKKIN